MLKSLNTSATGMAAQQSNMDVIANNLANVSTTGFKKSRAEFEDLMYQTIKEPGSYSGANAYSPNGVQVGLGVRTAGVQKDFSEGSVVTTKQPLDLQIEGAGFFQLQLPDGSLGYTRDGSFKKDPSGRVVDKNGHPLVPELSIPPNVVGLEISPAGQVRVIQSLGAPPTDLGQIELAQFVNPAGLKSLGKNVFVSSSSSGQALINPPGSNGLGSIAQGQVEASNVNIVDEMVNMITAQRAYETNSKVIQASDQMLQTINALR
jgi:flagellar basal-body rod protein FlgG